MTWAPFVLTGAAGLMRRLIRRTNECVLSQTKPDAKGMTVHCCAPRRNLDLCR
jgi:hypothetical protein